MRPSPWRRSSARASCWRAARRSSVAWGASVTEKWGPRIIDLDLLVYRDRAVNDPDLVLPHPHIGARAFVLAPLMDVAPDLVIDGKSVRDMYDAIDVSSVKPLD